MKLYKEVLIESAEQAEALLDGALLILDSEAPAVVGPGDRVWIAGGDGFHTTRSVIAEHTVVHLVPIEAEEEHTRPVHLYSSTVHVAPASSADKPSARLVTPWEEA